MRPLVNISSSAQPLFPVTSRTHSPFRIDSLGSRRPHWSLALPALTTAAVAALPPIRRNPNPAYSPFRIDSLGSRSLTLRASSMSLGSRRLHSAFPLLLSTFAFALSTFLPKAQAYEWQNSGIWESAIAERGFDSGPSWFSAGPAWMMNAMPGSNFRARNYVIDSAGDREESTAEAPYVGTLHDVFNVNLFSNVSFFATASGVKTSPFSPQSLGTNVDWTGATSTNFETPTNWSGNAVPANDQTTNTAHFTGTVTANQPQITTTRAIAGLLFDTAPGGWTLSSSSTSNTLTIGAGGVSTVGQTSGTNIISANLSAISQTWVVGTNGTLQIDGTLSVTSIRTITLGTSGNTGTLLLNGTDTNFLGHFVIITGSLGIGNNSALGSGDLTFGGTNANTPTLFASGAGRTISNTITLAAVGTGSATINGSNDLTISGPITETSSRTLTSSITGGKTLTLSGNVFLSDNNTTGGRGLTINGTGQTVISGVVANNSGGNSVAASLTYSGSGGLTLSNTNTYTGATTVSGGTVLVNGSIAAGTGVTVSNAGTVLGGTGTINENVAVGASSAILGGAGAAASGTLTVNNGSLTLASNSIIELALGTSGTHSTLAHTGTGAISFATNQDFKFIDLGATPGAYTGLITGVTDPGTALTTWVIDNPGYTGVFTWDPTNGGEIDLTLSAIPETSTWVIGALALGAIGVMGRKRFSKG